MFVYVNFIVAQISRSGRKTWRSLLQSSQAENAPATTATGQPFGITQERHHIYRGCRGAENKPGFSQAVSQSMKRLVAFEEYLSLCQLTTTRQMLDQDSNDPAETCVTGFFLAEQTRMTKFSQYPAARDRKCSHDDMFVVQALAGSGA